jgi:hypothetical protein
LGVDRTGIKIINETRGKISEILNNKFRISENEYFNFFGKKLTISNNFILISHWTQSSISDMSFEYFNIVKEATGLLPVHPIHDGCLWVEDGNSFFRWIKSKNFKHEFFFESPIDNSINHIAKINWEKI